MSSTLKPSEGQAAQFLGTVIHYVRCFYRLLKIVSQLVIKMDIISLRALEDLG